MALVHNNPKLMKGVDNDLPIVLDIEDKITAKELPYTLENIIDFTKASLDSRIGEISNCGTSYVNKYAPNETIKKRYDDYCCLLSVINGKEIDYAKTGVRWNVPRMIAKYSKPLPYFIKYKYPQLKTLDNSPTKMNEHCWFIEKWQNQCRKTSNINTSHCLYDASIPVDEVKYKEVAKVFKEFKKAYKKLENEEHMAKNYDKYKDFFIGFTKEEVMNSHYDWDGLYDTYRNKLEEIVPNKSELANYLVDLIYNKMKGINRGCELLWKVARDGLMANLRVNRVQNVLVPIESKDGTGVEYLGKYYKLTEYKGEI